MPAMPAASSYHDKIPHPPASALDLATIMRTLGDPVRLEIVRLLGDDRPRVCNELSSALGIPPSTGSFPPRLLRAGGVTPTHARGTLRLISRRRDGLEDRFPGLVDVLTR